MRVGTLLVLLGFVLLVAFFGWQVLGWIALSILVFVLLSIAIVAGAIWYIKRRIERKVAEVAKALAGERGGDTAPFRRSGPGDVIDVEGTVRKPRDGADDPDSLDGGPFRPSGPSR